MRTWTLATSRIAIITQVGVDELNESIDVLNGDLYKYDNNFFCF